MHKQFLEHHNFSSSEKRREYWAIVFLRPPGNLNGGLWIPKEAEREEAGGYLAMPGWTEVCRAEQQGRALPTWVV